MATNEVKYEGGDKEAGYTVIGYLVKSRMYVKLWGIWKNQALIPQFQRDILVIMGLLAARGQWNVFGDLRDFPAQPQVIGKLIGGLMMEAMKRRFNKCAVLAPSAITKLFITGLARSVNMTTLKCFDTVEQAEAFLSER